MVSTHRPSADGYQKAPVVEAILDVMFEPVSDDTIRLINSDLSEFYPNSEQRVRRFKLEASTETVTASEESLIFHLSGEDPTEMAYLRRDGFSSVQLAPYRCWEDLIERFRRDLNVLRKNVSSTPSRIATRFINRIDVQFEGELARHEEYFQAFIHLPDPFEDIGKFSF